MFDWIIYTILGLVQGITEWLPISSSGHLVIAQELFGVEIPGLTFEIVLHFSSFLAMIVVFWRDLWKLIVGFFAYLFKKDKSYESEYKMGLYIIIATIPAGLLGVLFGDLIEELLSGFVTVSLMLLVTGLGLFFVSKANGTRTEITLRDAIVVGIFQAVALIPGISRAGSTLFGALYQGLEKGVAIRFSFFMAIPVSLGVILLKINDFAEQFHGEMIFNYILAFVVTFVSAIIAIKWFMGVLEKGKLIYFTYYCWIVGIGLLLYYYIFS